MSNILHKTEQRAYRLLHADGLLDMSIALIIAGFALIPIANESIQDDFWSSFLLLPLYFGVFWGYRWLKRKFTTPRIGFIRFRLEKKSKIFLITLIMSVVLGLSVIIGALFFAGDVENGWVVTLFLSGIIFLSLTLASFLVDLPRLILYGILCAGAAPLGEWLWNQSLVTHHGIPLTFGLTALVIFLYGGSLFLRFIKKYDIPQETNYE